MKIFCDFCNQPVAMSINIDDPFFNLWVCLRCIGNPMYVFKDNIHICNEFWFPKTFDAEKQMTMFHILRTNFVSLINYKNQITFATEILTFENSLYRAIYQSNEVSHITPFNVKHKLDTILTFL